MNDPPFTNPPRRSIKKTRVVESRCGKTIFWDRNPERIAMRRLLLALTALALTPTLAWAHTGVGHAAGFLHGFEHPIGGVDHVLAMVAVGVFAYVLGGRALWLVPLSFVGMMVVGFVLGVAQVDVPFVELGIALSSVVIGGAAALGRPMPVAGAMALVGVFAIFHGHAHGAEMPADSSGLTYAAGFVVATALLHLAGIAATFGAARIVGKYGRTVAQIAGGAFALGGIGVLAGWL
jgi:urease accessory protein